jgi:hypothetical protein
MKQWHSIVRTNNFTINFITRSHIQKPEAFHAANGGTSEGRTKDGSASSYRWCEEVQFVAHIHKIEYAFQIKCSPLINSIFKISSNKGLQVWTAWPRKRRVPTFQKLQIVFLYKWMKGADTTELVFASETAHGTCRMTSLELIPRTTGCTVSNATQQQSRSP